MTNRTRIFIVSLVLALAASAHAYAVGAAVAEEGVATCWCSVCDMTVTAMWQCGDEDRPCSYCEPDLPGRDSHRLVRVGCHWVCPNCGAFLTPYETDLRPSDTPPIDDPPIDPEVPIEPEWPTQYDLI